MNLPKIAKVQIYKDSIGIVRKERNPITVLIELETQKNYWGKKFSVKTHKTCGFVLKIAKANILEWQEVNSGN